MDVSMTKTLTAEYWITNAPATDKNKVNTLTISSDMEGITEDAGIPVTELAPEIRTNIIGYETTVFGHARVLGNRQRQIEYGTDRSTFGTEIDAIRYHGNYLKHFEYHDKKNDRWERFSSSDQLVFYYLVRTDYSKMVQIDVSDWAYDDLDANEVDDSYRNHPDHRSVTYQVHVKNADGSYTLTDNRKFWYSKTFTVSSVLVRQADADRYTIDHVELDPGKLGDPTANENGEYQFSLDLTKTDRNATVKIYVKPNVQPVQLTYDLNDGTITSTDGTYSLGSVYPDATIILPTAEKDNCTFDGWYDETGKKYETGARMPNEDLTLYAKFTAKETPKPEPEPENQKAMYFVLLPNRGVPKSGASQGKESYLPNDTSDGGVTGRNAGNGYEGYLTEAGKAIADAKYTGYDATNGYTKIDNVGVESKYLLPPTNLGFFTKANWNGANYTPSTNFTDITALLGEKFNPQIAEVVWYTIKKQSDGYHVDGYVKNVDVTVTYHSNFGDAEQTKICTATTGTNYEALDYADTKLPTRENYTFGGWYTDKNCTTAYETTTLMTSLDLYAKWVPNKFAVSYFVDGSVYKIDGKEQISSHVNGEEVTLLDKPTKTGYTFDGWKHNYATSIVNVVDGKFTMPAQNVLFNGTFEINQYNVTYKVGTEVVYTDVYNFDADVAIRPVPTKDGYTFIGWKIGDKDAENFKMPAHNVEIHGSYSQNTRKYNRKQALLRREGR